jgi:hypothetical protein
VDDGIRTLNIKTLETWEYVHYAGIVALVNYDRNLGEIRIFGLQLPSTSG